MFSIKVGGVPEHFNYPWLKCIENKSFQDSNINLKWINQLGGTGEMVKSLSDKTIDIAIMLTEGCIKSIKNGNDFKIIQKYIESPLIWGIHVSAKSNFTKISDLEGKTAAISQYNSGSHLMTYILAEKYSWNINNLQFKVCNNLDGAINALQDQSVDYLLWERFTTKPYVDSQKIKHLGNCPTPWPCFVIVARNQYYQDNYKNIMQVLNILNRFTQNLKNQKNLEETLSKRYDIKKDDINQWLNITEWSQSTIKSKTTQTVVKKLKDFEIL